MHCWMNKGVAFLPPELYTPRCLTATNCLSLIVIKLCPARCVQQHWLLTIKNQHLYLTGSKKAVCRSYRCIYTVLFSLDLVKSLQNIFMQKANSQDSSPTHQTNCVFLIYLVYIYIYICVLNSANNSIRLDGTGWTSFKQDLSRDSALSKCGSRERESEMGSEMKSSCAERSERVMERKESTTETMKQCPLSTALTSLCWKCVYVSLSTVCVWACINIDLAFWQGVFEPHFPYSSPQGHIVDAQTYTHTKRCQM